ncbi:MAG: hypothetical protein E7597_04840 [Ruminococcaceae bacterium]|nr:hypothetical protein [Oscillospiraceae bacterium]
MKKILAFVLAGLLAASALTACGGKKTEEKGGDVTSQTESKADQTESKAPVAVPDKIDDILIGAWTGADETAVGTYIFEKGGTGNFVSYMGDKRSVVTVRWGINEDKLVVSFDGSDVSVEYKYSVGEGEITLTANEKSIVYKSGPNPDRQDNAVEHQIDPAIAGDWSCTVDGITMAYSLNKDGSGLMTTSDAKNKESLDIRWYTEGEKLYISIRKLDIELELEEYSYRLEGEELVIIARDRYANKYQRVEEEIDYPKNGGDDNLAGNWYGTDFDMELEADGTGRYINGDEKCDAFWGIKDGQFYFTYIKDDKAKVSVYDYIADGGKLYITDEDGVETVLHSTSVEESAE